MDYGNAKEMVVVGEGSRQKNSYDAGSPSHNNGSRPSEFLKAKTKKRKENADLPDHTMINVDLS